MRRGILLHTGGGVVAKAVDASLLNQRWLDKRCRIIALADLATELTSIWHVSGMSAMVFRYFGLGRRKPKAAAAMTQQESRGYEIGQRIAGKYEVVNIFEGGLGRVYVVEDEGGLFVLKQAKSDLSRQEKELFADEARAWIQIGRHQNIVPAFWVQELAGDLYVAAEYVGPDEFGRTSLRDYLCFRRITLTQCFRWASEFCFGMEHALSKSLVAHRDIKPENLLIGSSAILQITDFGLASVNPVGDEIDELELPRSVAGTPPYMAPEQWQGLPQGVTVDIYAFGIVMHEMCFGRLPWVVTDIRSLFEAHMNKAPDVQKHPLREIMEVCLAKDPRARFSSPTELFDELKRVAKRSDLSIPPRPQPLNDEFEELCARATLDTIGDRTEASDAVKELTQKWPNYAGGWTALAKLHMEQDKLDEAEDALHRSLQIDATRSPPWNNLGLLFTKRERFRTAVESFKRALDADPENTGAMANMAQSLIQLKRHHEAINYLTNGTLIAPDKYIIWFNLGQVYATLGMKSKGKAALNKALSLAPAHFRSQIADAIEHIESLPDETIDYHDLLMDGRIEEAVEMMEQKVKIDPENRALLQNLGEYQLQLGREDASRQAFERLHQVDPENDRAWMQLMRLAAKRGDLEEAERWCDHYEKIPFFHARSKAFRAYVLEQCGQLQKAKSLLLQAMEDYPTEPDIFVAYGDLAMKNRVPSYAVGAYERAVHIIRSQPHEIERLREIEGKLSDAVDAAKKTMEH